jgi:capsular polysaccharide biosynthesis protein
MDKVTKVLLYDDSHDSVLRLLQSWRLWLIGAVVGALVAALLYAVFPPPHRARAVVVVDHNLEEVWEIQPAKQFYFLGREARKLEELAWSDDVLQQVADQVGDVTVRELRDEILSLSQPDDGGWHFFADWRDPQRAELIAGTWAQVFYQEVLAGMEVSYELEVMRREIPLIMESSPDISSGEAANLVSRMMPDLEESKGISPYLEVTLSQVENLKIKRKVPLSLYVLAGAGIGMCAFAYAGLVFLRAEEDNAFAAE